VVADGSFSGFSFEWRVSVTVHQTTQGFRHAIGGFATGRGDRDQRRLPHHVTRYKTPNTIDACRGNIRQTEAITMNSGDMTGICHDWRIIVTRCEIILLF